MSDFVQTYSREDWSPEITLGLRAIFFKLCVWDHNASYGASLQDLRYSDGRRSGPLFLPPSRWQKASYGLLTVVGRYGWDKWESWISNQYDVVEEVYSRSLH